MIDRCPICRQELHLSAAQLEKIHKALASLPTGQLLKLSCPLCKGIIELAADGSPAGGLGRQQNPAARPPRARIEPPAKPSLDWLAQGKFQHQEVIRDVPQVMVLMAAGAVRTKVLEAFAEIEYEQVLPKSTPEAIERLRFTSFAAVVLHSRFEGGSLTDSPFHHHMQSLGMGQRRSIFYVVIGPELHTLYNLQALSISANLVVNDSEVDKIGLILKKTIPEYEAFFAPYIEALLARGHKDAAVWADVRRRMGARKKSDVLKELLEIS